MTKDSSMKKLIILSLATALLAAPAFGFKQADLDKLKATNSCEKCDLTKADLRDAYLANADLSGADLNGANLSSAVLREANLDFADFTNAKLCNTVMPDGQRIFKDC
jgi:uncharacterized protein YjbI with pentapeptide repeats